MVEPVVQLVKEVGTAFAVEEEVAGPRGGMDEVVAPALHDSLGGRPDFGPERETGFPRPDVQWGGFVADAVGAGGPGVDGAADDVRPPYPVLTHTNDGLVGLTLDGDLVYRPDVVAVTLEGGDGVVAGVVAGVDGDFDGPGFPLRGDRLEGAVTSEEGDVTHVEGVAEDEQRRRCRTALDLLDEQVAVQVTSEEGDLRVLSAAGEVVGVVPEGDVEGLGKLLVGKLLPAVVGEAEPVGGLLHRAGGPDATARGGHADAHPVEGALVHEPGLAEDDEVRRVALEGTHYITQGAGLDVAAPGEEEGAGHVLTGGQREVYDEPGGRHPLGEILELLAGV